MTARMICLAGKFVILNPPKDVVLNIMFDLLLVNWNFNLKVQNMTAPTRDNAYQYSSVQLS